MERSERLATSVTEDTKTRFRVEAAKRDLSMSELLHEIVHDYLDEQDSGASEGNLKAVPQTAD